MAKKVVVSGVGCSLVDRLYNNVSFSQQSFIPYLSKEKGDGGLVPGQLVFRRDFEKFIGEDFHSLLKKLVNDKTHDKINIGGPGIVSMIHAAQLASDSNCEFHFYGTRGKDSDGEFIMSLLGKTPLFADNLIVSDSEDTPSTAVLSDPNYENGNGERIFINSIAAAWDYSPSELDDNFFASNIVVFGGTALVPLIHDNLTELLKKAKSNGCTTIVNTVYDFRNEKANPDKKWPLGKSDESYKNIDLLITDLEEALRLSGKQDVTEAIEFFRSNGTGALIITSGADNVRLFAQGNLFTKNDYSEMPISKAVSDDLKNGKGADGDTTGCGDNFVGGVIASVVAQIQDTGFPLNLKEATMCGIVSGGTATFYMGGMFEETTSGEKRKMIEPYYELYKNQVKS